MRKDERDLLEVLKFELQFLEDGGYGRSPRTPWRPQYIFEDSLTCMNYDSKENPVPCNDCVLMQLVPRESRSEKIPCRHIPFNLSGETLDSLYRYSNQTETEETVRNWLRATIRHLEEERAAARQASKQPLAAGGTVRGTPLIRFRQLGVIQRLIRRPGFMEYDIIGSVSVARMSSHWCTTKNTVSRSKVIWPELSAGETHKELSAA